MASEIEDRPVEPRFEIRIYSFLTYPICGETTIRTCNTVEEIGSIIQEAFRPYVQSTGQDDKKEIIVDTRRQSRQCISTISYSEIPTNIEHNSSILVNYYPRLCYEIEVPIEQISADNVVRMSACITILEDDGLSHYSEDTDSSYYEDEDEDSSTCWCADCVCQRCDRHITECYCVSDSEEEDENENENENEPIVMT